MMFKNTITTSIVTGIVAWSLVIGLVYLFLHYSTIAVPLFVGGALVLVGIAGGRDGWREGGWARVFSALFCLCALYLGAAIIKGGLS